MSSKGHIREPDLFSLKTRMLLISLLSCHDRLNLN